MKKSIKVIILILLSNIIVSCGEYGTDLELKEIGYKSDSNLCSNLEKTKDYKSIIPQGLQIPELTKQDFNEIITSHELMLEHGVEYIVGDKSSYDVTDKIQLARAVMENTRRVIPNTINQFQDLRENPKLSVLSCLNELTTSFIASRNKKPYLFLALDYGYQIATAMITKVGTCNHHSIISLLTLCSLEHDFPVYYCSTEAPEPVHYFCILGDPNDKDAVLVDPWTKDKSPVLFSESKLKGKKIYQEGYESRWSRKSHAKFLERKFEKAKSNFLTKENYSLFLSNEKLFLADLNNIDNYEPLKEEFKIIEEDHHSIQKDFFGRFIFFVSTQRKEYQPSIFERFKGFLSKKVNPFQKIDLVG